MHSRMKWKLFYTVLYLALLNPVIATFNSDETPINLAQTTKNTTQQPTKALQDFSPQQQNAQRHDGSVIQADKRSDTLPLFTRLVDWIFPFGRSYKAPNDNVVSAPSINYAKYQQAPPSRQYFSSGEEKTVRQQAQIINNNNNNNNNNGYSPCNKIPWVPIVPNLQGDNNRPAPIKYTQGNDGYRPGPSVQTLPSSQAPLKFTAPGDERLKPPPPTPLQFTSTSGNLYLPPPQNPSPTPVKYSGPSYLPPVSQAPSQLPPSPQYPVSSQFPPSAPPSIQPLPPQFPPSQAPIKYTASDDFRYQQNNQQSFNNRQNQYKPGTVNDQPLNLPWPTTTNRPDSIQIFESVSFKPFSTAEILQTGEVLQTASAQTPTNNQRFPVISQPQAFNIPANRITFTTKPPGRVVYNKITSLEYLPPKQVLPIENENRPYAPIPIPNLSATPIPPLREAKPFNDNPYTNPDKSVKFIPLDKDYSSIEPQPDLSKQVDVAVKAETTVAFKPLPDFENIFQTTTENRLKAYKPPQLGVSRPVGDRIEQYHKGTVLNGDFAETLQQLYRRDKNDGGSYIVKAAFSATDSGSHEASQSSSTSLSSSQFNPSQFYPSSQGSGSQGSGYLQGSGSPQESVNSQGFGKFQGSGTSQGSEHFQGSENSQGSKISQGSGNSKKQFIIPYITKERPSPFKSKHLRQIQLTGTAEDDDILRHDALDPQESMIVTSKISTKAPEQKTTKLITKFLPSSIRDLLNQERVLPNITKDVVKESLEERIETTTLLEIEATTVTEETPFIVEAITVPTEAPSTGVPTEKMESTTLVPFTEEVFEKTTTSTVKTPRRTTIRSRLSTTEAPLLVPVSAEDSVIAFSKQNVIRNFLKNKIKKSFEKNSENTREKSSRTSKVPSKETLDPILQHKIDEWTEQQFGKATTSHQGLATTLSFMYFSKPIPDSYISTISSLQKNAKIAVTPTISTTTRRSLTTGRHRLTYTESLDYVWINQLKNNFLQAKARANNNKSYDKTDKWKKLRTSISPVTKEKVYIVTPEVVHIMQHNSTVTSGLDNDLENLPRFSVRPAPGNLESNKQSSSNKPLDNVKHYKSSTSIRSKSKLAESKDSKDKDQRVKHGDEEEKSFSFW